MSEKSIFKIIITIISIVIVFFMLKYFFLTDKTLETGYTSLVNTNSTCITCHTPMSGFSKAHAPDKITCTSCHLGNNSSLDKEKAHQNMLTVPGNLSNASQTCAKCHQGIDVRVKNSLMNTMSGIISVDKYVFGENDNLDSLFNIHHLKNKTKAENHLRNKCASCHIGNEKENSHPITQQSRGGGCTACHLNYSEKGKIAHQKYIDSKKSHLTKIHPSLSLNITDNHCFGCHSRSGRIATNYMGWHETVYKDTLQNNPNYWMLDDKRIFEKKQEDIHHTKGLSCVDCHNANEVMGDGNLYAHQEDAVSVSCVDCHFNFEVKTILFDDLLPSEKRIVRLKKIDTLVSFIRASKSDKTLLNVIREGNINYLITKNSNQKLQLTPPSNNCIKNAHKNVSCSSCHTSWSPQCISCHTSFDANEDGFDLLSKTWKMGKWIEQGSDYLAEFPTLGVVEKNGQKTINTVAPGMIMHLKNDTINTNFHRLFAPVSAHTISSKGQNCKTCHNNPVALGYGRGKLEFTKNGIWKFTPLYELEQDGLPKDAWIPFLKEYTSSKSTRKNTRAFTVSEQQKILTVGSCLTCHKENSTVVKSILNDYQKAFENRSNECVEHS